MTMLICRVCGRPVTVETKHDLCLACKYGSPRK